MPGEKILADILSEPVACAGYPDYTDTNYGDESGYTDVYPDDDSDDSDTTR